MKKIDLLICIILVVLSLFLYIFRLEEIPLGMAIDEAHPSSFALMVNKGEYSIFDYKEGWGGSLIMAPIQVFFMQFWPSSPLPVRLPHAILASISVPIFYLLIQTLWANRLASLLTSALFLTSQWQISFARTGIPGMAVVFILLSCSLFLILAFKKQKWLYFALAGIFSGLILATYAGGFLFFLVIFVWWIINLYKKQNRRWFNLIIYVTFFLLIATPFLMQVWSNPNKIFSRVNNTSILLADYSERSLFLTYLKHFYQTWQMFGYQAPSCGPPCPAPTTLDQLTATIFFMGLLIAVLTIYRIESLWIVIWLLVMTNSSAFSEVSGLAHRSIGLLPSVYIIIALLLKHILNLTNNFRATLKHITYIALVIVVLYISHLNIFNYFDQQLNNRELAYHIGSGGSFYEYNLAKFAYENQDNATIYAWPTGDSFDFDNYILRDKKIYNVLNKTTSLGNLRPPTLFYFPAKEEQLLKKLQTTFPSGKPSQLSDYWGYPVAYIFDLK